MYVISQNGGFRWVDPSENYELTAGEIFSDEEPESPVAGDGAQGVPASVTPLQARRALLAAGKLDAVNTAVAAADPDTKLAWEFATSVERGSSFVASLATAIGLTDSQVDDLFRTAATLN